MSALAVLLLVGAQDALPPAPVGDDLLGRSIVVPSRSEEVYNRFGIRTIYQLLHRKPLLVVFWRASEREDVDKVVPAALELGERWEGDLALLLVERSGLSYSDMLREAAARRWLCGDALWSCEVPSGLEDVRAPSFALASMRHAGLLTGDLRDDEAALGKALAAVVDERRRGEADLPPEAREAWEALHEGELADALQLPRAAEKRRARGDPADGRAAQLLDLQAKYVEDVVSNEIQLAAEMTRSGSTAEAEARLERLAKGLRDLPTDHALRMRAETELEVLRHGGLLLEAQASEALDPLLERLCKSGTGPGLAKSLRDLAAEHAGTAAGSRARFLADVVDGP